MAFPCSTCSHKNGLITVCKRGDQAKPRRTLFGRERGHWFSILDILDATLTSFFSIFQMSLLEMEDVGESSPHGVVLFLVGSDPDSGKEQESNRILRMYNLASLINLAKWAISHKVCQPPLVETTMLRDCIGRQTYRPPPTTWVASTSGDIEKAKVSWSFSKRI